MTAVVAAPGSLFGDQLPRVRSVPACDVSLGDDAVAFAARCGLYLDPWQQLVLRDAMGVLRNGRWASSQVGTLVPRQNGKGAILEALELFHMFVLRTPLIVHSAHKFDTSQEHFLRLRTLIEANPDLDRHVKAMPTSQGHEAIVLRGGNRLKFKARTVGGAGRGFSADLLVLDEAMLLPEQALDAMMPTLRARKNPQVWFTSSAGTPDSDALWRIVKRGREGADRLCYHEWGCPSGADPLDRRNWAQANPGLGYRLSVEGLEDDLGLLSQDGFAREHLGIWDDASAVGVFDRATWDALADPDAERGSSVSFGVATAPDRTWAAVAVAWRRLDGNVQAMLAAYDETTAWVSDRVRELLATWGGQVRATKAALDLAPGAKDEPQARADNVLADMVTAGTLRHGNQAALNVAVRGARWRTSGDSRVLDQRGSIDISPLVAVSQAVYGLTNATTSGWMVGV